MSEDLKFDFSKIGIGEIIEETKRLTENFKAVPHNVLLQKMLDDITLVDFRAEAGFEDPQGRLSKKHFLVLVIEIIKRKALEHNWALCTYNGEVFIFNGCFWKEIQRPDLERFLSEAAIKMGVDKFDAKFFEFKTQLLKQFFSDSFLQKREFEGNIISINLMNGTYEISPTQQNLRGFCSSDFLTYQLPFEYDPNAKCPLFFKYLTQVLPDFESQKILSEFVAYLFVSPNFLKLEKALILHGSGANGKSVFFEIIVNLIGPENVSNFSLHSLTDKSGYYRAKIGNKLLNYASELTSEMQTDIFKQMVSGEPIEARLPYKEPFTLTNYARMIFNCNELPKDIEHTNAFFRRFLIIPFDVQISPENQDPELAKKIIECELSGVFNWILEGLKRLLDQRGFSNCQASENALAKYRVESDSVKLFLSENNITQSHINWLYLKDLYSEYSDFCKFGNYKPCSNKTFSERLRGDGIVLERRKAGYVAFLEKKVLEIVTTPSPYTPSDVPGVVDEDAILKRF